MNVFDLFAKLSLDSSEYEAGLDDAEKKGSSFGAGLKKAAKITTGAVVAVGTAVAGATVYAIKGASEVAQYGDHIDKMSQKMGLSAEAYQEWDAILQHSGTSIDTMQAGMKTLANAVENGNDAFGRIGLSMNDVAAMSNEELFAATIKGLQNVDNETERTYLAGQLLGRGATELGALLNTSAEDTEAMRQRVHELGGVMSNEAVKAAAAYQDSLQDMKTGLAGLKRNMMGQFMPSIKKVMDGMTELFAGDSDKGLGLINDGIDSVIDTLSDMIPKFLEIGGKIVLSLASAIIQNLPKLIEAGTKIIVRLASTLVQKLPEIIKIGIDIILSLTLGIAQALPELIPAVVQAIFQIVETLTNPDMINTLIQAAFQIVGALATGLINSIPIIVENIPKIIAAIVNALVAAWPTLKESGKNMILSLADGIAGETGENQSIGKALGTIILFVLKKLGELLLALGKWLKDTAWPAIWEALKGLGASIWEKISTWAGGVWEKIKTWVGNKFDALKLTVGEKMDAIKLKFSEKLEAFKTAASEKWEAIKTTFSNAIEKIKGFFNFEWSLPKIKLPHFKKTGTTVLGLPKIGVDWYKKAYENPYLFTEPTVVGNKGFGDGNGAEMVYGRDALMRDIREAVGGIGGGVTINVYQREGEDTMELTRRIEQDLLKIMKQGRVGALA